MNYCEDEKLFSYIISRIVNIEVYGNMNALCKYSSFKNTY
ncbi:MAG: hypothetical protein K0R00_4299 [Herbinix sp.]|nr:hypothetical protein [Herbinix sp.]